MRYLQNFGDRRQTALCVHCGDTSVETLDHVPSKVLLDCPYPDQLPTVNSCRKCNEGFSEDELYLACLIECVLCGSTEPEELKRPKIARALRERPLLARRLAAARYATNGRIIFSVEHDRVQRVIVKLARSHALYELNEPQLTEPANIGFYPIGSLSEDGRQQFETGGAAGLVSVWPEVGSRAMQRLAESWRGEAGWLIVQPGRYRYIASADPEGVTVKMVLSEYLACEVIWEN